LLPVPTLATLAETLVELSAAVALEAMLEATLAETPAALLDDPSPPSSTLKSSTLLASLESEEKHLLLAEQSVSSYDSYSSTKPC
jgi:hypothetical protein